MEQKYDEGFSKGKDKGFLEGQQKEKLLLASRMLETGIEEDFVVKITGLNPEEITRLKEELKSLVGCIPRSLLR